MAARLPVAEAGSSDGKYLMPSPTLVVFVSWNRRRSDYVVLN